MSERSSVAGPLTVTRPFGSDSHGLRVLRRIGFDRILPFIAAVWVVTSALAVITQYRPDLLNPTAIGTDASNYYAAGQRLNHGHALYHLSPGDREVPLLPPPQSDAALLSPPLVGVVWRPLAQLGDVSMVVWWAAGVAVLGGLALFMALRGSIRRSLVLYFVAPVVGLAMWSGNVNPFVVALLVGVWVAASTGRSSLAGSLLAIAGGLKLTPIWLAWWLIVRRDWTALRAFLATGAALAVISLLGAGWDNHLEYLSVITTTGTMGATPWSLAGFLHNWGVPTEIASLALFGWVGLGVAAIWLLRHRPGASFAVGILTVLYSSPVVMLGNLAVLLAATAPFPKGPAVVETVGDD